MTKKQFEKKYPNGIRSTVHSFNKAVYKIFSTKEIDKIIASEKWYKRKKLKQLKSYLAGIENEFDVPHWVVMVNMIYSPVLYKDILSYMIMDCNERYTGNDLE